MSAVSYVGAAVAAPERPPPFRRQLLPLQQLLPLRPVLAQSPRDSMETRSQGQLRASVSRYSLLCVPVLLGRSYRVRSGLAMLGMGLMVADTSGIRHRLALMNKSKTDNCVKDGDCTAA